jgi:hypothetical protein
VTGDPVTDRNEPAAGIAFHNEVMGEYLEAAGLELPADEAYQHHKRILGAALARRDAAVASRALTDAADAMESEPGEPPDDWADWLRARAAR